MPRDHSASRSNQFRPARRRYEQGAATHVWTALCDRRDMCAAAHVLVVGLIASQDSLVPVLSAYAVSAYVFIITIRMRYPSHILNKTYFTRHSSDVHLLRQPLLRRRRLHHLFLRLLHPQVPCHLFLRLLHPRLPCHLYLRLLRPGLLRP